MAGFIDRGRSGLFNKPGGKISKLLRDLSSFGMRYDDMILKNSKAIGVTENQFLNTYAPVSTDDDMWYTFAAMSLTDTSLKKDMCIFNKEYERKRLELREFSLQDEIEDILDTLTDECLVYDYKNYFSSPVLFNDNMDDKLKQNLDRAFKKIYTYFNFNDGLSAWNFFRKWLVDGYIAFEIIYDTDNKNIIGFKELDPNSLEPAIEKKTNKKIYIQYKGQGAKERHLYDSQIIYIAWSGINTTSRVSYVERLVRSFNLLRILEHTRVIWAVTNASFKTMFTIPIGGKSKTRAKQSLAQLMHNYREIVDFDYKSGEIYTNGKPMMPFNKEYWMPSKDGEKPEADVLGGEGPDLSDTDALKYFNDKLKLASKIPFNRFDKDSPAGYEIAAEGTLREEIKFSKFVNRMRSIFQEILVKPLYIQMILDNPGLKDDERFKASISIRYNKENVFEDMKQMELIEKRIDFIERLKDGLVEQDKDLNDVPYFDLHFLVDRYGQFTEEDLQTNRKYKEIKRLEKDGYKRKDAKRIVDGEPKDKFKKEDPPADPITGDMAF